MAALWHKRELQINDYISQTVSLLFKKVKACNIDTVVVGYNAGWKQKSDMGQEGIRFLKPEEGYTSKNSFLKDPIPFCSKDDRMHYHFSGKRITLGLYQSKAGTCIHADSNGTLNTLQKSRVVELNENLKVDSIRSAKT